jgi:hypothetical protein
MDSLYASVLPFALGAAVSPTLLTIELLILSGKTKPKARAWFFVLGASATLLAFAILCATVLSRAGDANGGPVNPWTVAIEGFVVVLLIAVGIRQLRPKKTPGEQHQSRVKSRLATASLPFFFGVGAVAMIANFSTLVLYLPATHVITRSTAPESTKVAASLMLFVITILPFWIPVLSVTIVGHRSDAFLAKVNALATRYSRQVNAGVCFLFAAIIAVSLFQHLTG